MDARRCVKLTSVRLEPLERHGLLVVIVLVLPHVVAPARAALAPVAEVGHLRPIASAQRTENTSNQSHPRLQLSTGSGKHECKGGETPLRVRLQLCGA